MRYYIVSDIHGFYNETVAALTETGFFDNRDSKKLVLAGDALDRGPDSLRMTDFLLEQQAKNELIFVRGNHEDLLLRILDDIANGRAADILADKTVHIHNGTWYNVMQLSGMSAQEILEQPQELVARVKASPFYRELLPHTVDFLETEHYIITHGWIPVFAAGEKPHVTYRYNPDWRNADAEAFKAARWLNGMDMACTHGITEPGKTIVCGHFPAAYGRALMGAASDAVTSPFYADGIIAIDAHTAKTGRVNCLVIED